MTGAGGKKRIPILQGGNNVKRRLAVRAIAVVGWKDSGKTTLAARLIAALKQRGLRVGAAKSSHHGFDRSDLDTGRLAAEADVVAGSGPSEAMLLWPANRDLRELIRSMDVDFVVVEGGKSLDWLPRVVIADDPDKALELDHGLALCSVGAKIEGKPLLTEVEEIADLALERGFLLEGLNCGACGHPECGDLAREIVSGRVGAEECMASGEDLRILVEGTELGLNQFVRSILSGTLTGMLSRLKGYAPGRVRIELNTKEEDLKSKPEKT
jgi:molybdopterin-guanine dinucleotide biosynthesis adapter protein